MSLRIALSALVEQFRTIRSNAPLAWSVLTGRHTSRTPLQLMLAAESASGCYPLESISVDSLLEDIAEAYEPQPQFARLARRAAISIADSWDSSNSIAYVLAMFKFERLARDEGVPLRRTR